MKADWSHLEPHRVQTAWPPWGSCPGDRYGMFQFSRGEVKFIALVSTGINPDSGEPDSIVPWEHVSVRACYVRRGKITRERTPTWDEMCFIKSLFWDDEESVMQLHPPKSEYVNFHSTVLHLWKPLSVDIPRPPKIAV